MKNLSFLILITLSLYITGDVFATVYTVQSGDWNDSNTWWDDSIPGNGLPTSSDWTYVRSNGTVVDANTGSLAGHLIVGRWDNGTGTLNVGPGDTITASGLSSHALSIGYTTGPTTAGVVNMNGGTISCIGYANLGHSYSGGATTGTLNISDGIITISERFQVGYDGGNAEINQTGGTIIIDEYFYMNGYDFSDGNTKYTISGNSTLTANGWYNYIDYFGATDNSGDNEFRIVGPDPNISFYGQLHIHRGYDNSTPEPNNGGCTLGFDIEAGGIAPIKIEDGWLTIGKGTIFDFNGGTNGSSYLIADVKDPWALGDIIYIDDANVVVTELDTYELRLSGDSKQLFVDVIGPVCVPNSEVDFNEDCIVNWKDAKIITDNWLVDTSP